MKSGFVINWILAGRRREMRYLGFSKIRHIWWIAIISWQVCGLRKFVFSIGFLVGLVIEELL
jgi:hypothetical protein